jgi:hypothetical protein
MSNHAWCRDVASDAAVRAAEDGRDRPLPTLEECIETAFSAGVRDSFRKVEEAWSMIPKSVSASSAPEQENKGDGMRTERVTLEVTHDDNDGHIQFRNWDQMLFGEQNGVRFPGESVRVVEDDRILAASKKLIEVDQEAALRGFDTTTFQRLWISAIARVLGLELARPPRSKCDNPGDGSIPSPGILASPALVEAHQQIAALTAERDAAIREREKAVAESERRLRLCETMKRDGDSARFHAAVARARVAELEAASGGGKGEPVAWRVEYRGFIELYSVEQFATERASEVRGTVVPLYRSPPQPRGWLTEEESDALFRIVADEWPPQANGVRDSIIRSLLARSTPPKVVKPDRWRDDIYDGDRIVVGDQRDAEWLAALAAAGVEVKEVGRE